MVRGYRMIFNGHLSAWNGDSPVSDDSLLVLNTRVKTRGDKFNGSRPGLYPLAVNEYVSPGRTPRMVSISQSTHAQRSEPA